MNAKKKAKAKTSGKTKGKTKQVREYKARGSAEHKAVKNPKEKVANTAWENTTKFDILEDVQMPWTRIHAREIIYPFEGMGVGQSFQFAREADKGQNVYSASVSYCRHPLNFHKKFVIRKISEYFENGIKWAQFGCWREDDLSPEKIKQKRRLIQESQDAQAKKRRER